MHAQIAGPYDVRTSPAGTIADDSPSRWPEGNWFTSRHGDYELILSRRDLADRQVSAILRGEAEFALAAPSPAGPPPTERAVLSILLVESEGVQTLATRVVTLSMDLTLALHETIRAQGRRLLAPGTQERAAERMLRQGIAGDGLLTRAIARSLGNL